jgi:hypothetical protein
MNDPLHCNKQRTFLPIINSGNPLCCWQAIANHANSLEQSLRLLEIERVEAFGEPAVDRSE